MKVLICEAEEWERAASRSLSRDHQVVYIAGPLDERNAVAHADTEVVSPSVHSDLTAGLLAKFPRLRLVATRSTGFDHIDLGYCAAHGITVCNVPDYGDATVAEHAFALLLAAVRHVVPAVERTRTGDFSQSGLRGIELRGKTLGLIGAGRIGRHVAEIANGFGMKVFAHDPMPDMALQEKLNLRYGHLQEVIAVADVLTLHVPASPQTRHLIGDREFDLMKHGAVLINTSRGLIIDTEALIRSLSSGRLRAVGLDVLPQERLVREEAEIFRAGYKLGPESIELLANHVLLQFPNVIVTPHIAYDTEEAIHRIIDTTIDNIGAFFSGLPQNLVSIRPAQTDTGQADHTR